MDRRNFIKKTAMAAAGTALAAPVSAVLTKAESAKLFEDEVAHSRQTTRGGKGREADREGKESSLEQEEHKQTKTKLKVLMVNGSPRPDGNTFCCLKEIEKQLQKHGLETEIVQIGRQPVRMCINCGGCHQNGGQGCVFDDDMCSEITQKMASADALVVGTPVYYGQPNGGILSLMQRLFFSAGHLVQNKPAAAVAVCRRGGATATLQTMNMMFEMMNMPVVTSQYWNIAYGAGKGEAKLDTEGMQTMRTLGNNMAFLLQKIHVDGNTAPKRDERPTFMNFIR